jgi:hypothetical protein
MHDFLVALARKIGVLKKEKPARRASFEKVKTPPSNGSLTSKKFIFMCSRQHTTDYVKIR